MVPASLRRPEAVLHPLLAASLLAAGFLLPVGLSAQSLRGSPASVDRMHGYAERHGLHFYETATGAHRAARKGAFVRIRETSNLELHNVSYPYARPATALFLRRLASEYRTACGERLVVTSALRPVTDQPPNGSAESVHPTGIAVDLRRPTSGRCLRWLRRTLLTLEERRVIEATEEHHPAHFHIAVFGTPYTRYVAARQRATETGTELAAGGR